MTVFVISNKVLKSFAFFGRLNVEHVRSVTLLLNAKIVSFSAKVSLVADQFCLTAKKLGGKFAGK